MLFQICLPFHIKTMAENIKKQKCIKMEGIKISPSWGYEYFK